jgi:ankyrin repeat protein
MPTLIDIPANPTELLFSHCGEGALTALHSLLSSSPHPDELQDYEGNSLLAVAVLNEHLHIVDYLIPLHSQLFVNSNIESLLSTAASTGDLPIFTRLLQLLQHPGAPSVSPSIMAPSLVSASRQGHTRIIRHIFAALPPSARTRQYLSPCMKSACESGHAAVVSLLIDSHADPHNFI